MNEIQVGTRNVPARAWMKAIPGFCDAVMKRLGKRGWELSVVLCGRAFSRSLNRTWRGIDAATDVLSFPQGAAPCPGRLAAGDLVVSLPVVAENARRFGVQGEEELRRVLVHGILHLAGMDHADNSPRRKMLRVQEKILLDIDEIRFLWREK